MAQALDLWVESVERYNARHRDARRWEWVRYFDKMARLHSQLAADYTHRADRLCQEEDPPAHVRVIKDRSGPYPETGGEQPEQAVASCNGQSTREG